MYLDMIADATVIIRSLAHLLFGMSDDDDQQRFPCRHCGRQLRADEQPCPGCGNRGMTITQQVDERINIQERRTRVLATLERDLRFY
jgi:ABC-type ATPase with predicted acetyltransferase domain